MTVALAPRTIAVVGLDGAAPAAEVADWLADGLAVHGSVAGLSAGVLSTIDQAERDSDRVVLRGGTAPDDEWTALCVREADLVVAVSVGAPDPGWIEQATALQGCELIVFGSRRGERDARRAAAARGSGDS